MKESCRPNNPKEQRWQRMELPVGLQRALSGKELPATVTDDQMCEAIQRGLAHRDQARRALTAKEQSAIKRAFLPEMLACIKHAQAPEWNDQKSVDSGGYLHHPHSDTVHARKVRGS